MIHKNLYIIDIMHLAHRCYHVHKDLFTSTGKPVGMIYGAKNFLEGFIDQFHPDYLVAARECEGETWRHILYPSYKGNRKEKEEDFLAQLPNFFKLFEEVGIPVYQFDGYEADDVIGSIANKYGKEDTKCFIVSADKDFMQLVSKNVNIVKPLKNKTYEIIGTNEVVQKTGLLVSQIVDYLGLVGDTADNLPGVKGVGPKTAEKLLKSHADIEGVYNCLFLQKKPIQEKLIKSQKDCFMTRALARIVTDLDVNIDFESAEILREDLSKDNVINFYKSLEFQV